MFQGWTQTINKGDFPSKERDFYKQLVLHECLYSKGYSPFRQVFVEGTLANSTAFAKKYVCQFWVFRTYMCIKLQSHVIGNVFTAQVQLIRDTWNRRYFYCNSLSLCIYTSITIIIWNTETFFVGINLSKFKLYRLFFSFVKKTWNRSVEELYCHKQV